MPDDMRRALGSLAPASLDEAAGTLEAVLATATPVRRRDPAGPYDETLVISPEAVRLGRLNAGAPVLDSHQSWSLGDQIGAVIPGSARIENGQVVARLALTARPERAGIVADIKAGIIKNVSAGYRVIATEQEDVPGGVPVVRVTDWEPMEVSFVPVPADPSAQTRALPTIQDNHMPNQTNENQNRAGAYSPADRQRIAETCLGDVPADFLQRTATIDDRAFHQQIVAELYRREQEQPQTLSAAPVHVYGRQADDGLNEAVTAALAARMGGPAPQGRARELAGQSLVQIAAELAESRGERVAWRNRSATADQVFRRIDAPSAGTGWLARSTRSMGGLHATSDFPSLLVAAGQRVLANAYESAESPLKTLARKRTAQDFRTISVARLSEMPSLERVGEGGEVSRGSVAESVEAFKLETFARIFGVTRQALLNDDLNAFGDALAAFGRAAATKEADLLADLLAANGGAGATMADGVALFHASHGNKAASGSGIDAASLGAARRALRETVGLDGKTPLGLAPKHLLVGSDMETVAEQLLGQIYAAKSSDVVPEGLKLALHVEPRLNGSGFRVFADPSAAEVMSYAYLSGAEGVQFAQREGFDVLGIEFRGLLDFGCGITGHRGAHWTPAA